jgi:hypothetical protein
VRAAAASLLAIAVCLAVGPNGSPGASRRGTALTSVQRQTAAAYFPGTGTWYRIEQGHLVVGRAGAPRWRSAGLFPERLRLGVVAASRQGVAFSYHKYLYVARPHGRERPVARGEGAVGWTAKGLYTYGGPGDRLLLRSATGKVIRTVARRPQEHAYDPATGSLYLVNHGALIVAHGARVQQTASLKALGLPPRATQLIPLSGLIELMTPTRIVILRPDGSVFASTPLPRNATISSGLAVAPGENEIAFTAAFGQSEDPNTTRRAHGTEIIYVLGAGMRKAFPVHTEHVTFEPCERGAGVTWHGGWLRYANSEGNVASVRA